MQRRVERCGTRKSEPARTMLDVIGHRQPKTLLEEPKPQDDGARSRPRRCSAGLQCCERVIFLARAFGEPLVSAAQPQLVEEEGLERAPRAVTQILQACFVPNQALQRGRVEIV